MPRGGKRENCGRKKIDENEKSKQYHYYLRPDEKIKMDELFFQLKSVREKAVKRDLSKCCICEECGRETILPTKYNHFRKKWVCSACS